MKKQKTPILRITALMLLAFCEMIPATADMEKQVTQKTFDVKPGGRLTVDSDLGTIDVKTSEQEKVEVIATKDPQGKSDSNALEALADFEIRFQQNGSHVGVHGKFKRGHEYWQKRGYPLRVHFQVTVPRQSHVKLKTVSNGDIHVSNLEGPVRAEASFGNLRFDDIQGTVWGKNLSGRITLKNCQSDVNAESNSGDIDLSQVTGNVNAKTGLSGNIQVRDVGGAVRAETSTGDLRFDEVKGDIWGRTGISGKIAIKDCEGNVNVATGTSGKIHLSDIAGTATARGKTIQMSNVKRRVKATAWMSGRITLKNCQSDVDAESNNGDIDLSQVTGNVNAKTGLSGNIQVRDVGGAVRAETSTGDLHFDEVKGDIWGRTGMSGNITLKACSSLDVETSSGKISAEITYQPQLPSRLQTSFGEIVVTLDPDIAVDVDAESRNHLKSTVPVAGTIAKNKLKGTLNGGGPLLKLIASSCEILSKEK